LLASGTSLGAVALPKAVIKGSRASPGTGTAVKMAGSPL